MDASKRSQLLKVHELIVFAEHFQFYMRDANAEPDMPIYWDDEDKQNLVMLGDRVISVGTARDLDVGVTLELYGGEPEDENLEEWDHVVELAIDVPSGALIVEGPTEGFYPECRQDVEAGTYALRIYYGALDEVDDEGFEGEDFYRIVFWKTDEPPEFQVLKQWISRS